MSSDRLFSTLLHEESLFVSRSQQFLSFHAILIASMSLAGEAWEFRNPVATLGLVAAFLWPMVLHKPKRVIYLGFERIRREDSELADLYSEAGAGFRGKPLFLMWLLFPLLVGAFWAWVLLAPLLSAFWEGTAG